MSNSTAGAPIPAGASDPTASNIPGIWHIAGPMLLGHLFNYLLFGIFLIQLYIYTLSFKHDLIGIKILVWTVFLIDLVQTAFTTHYAWYVYGSGWGNPLVLRFYPLSLVTVAPLKGLVALAVQLFFAWRVWVLGERRKRFWPVLFLIVASAFGSCGTSIYAGVISGRSRDAIAGIDQLKPVVTAWFSSALACDTLITVTLVLQLYSRKGQGMERANNVIHRAMRLAIETGAVTTIFVSADLASFTHPQETVWFYMFGMFLGKLYSNSLLATLNSRSDYFKKPAARSQGSGGLQVFQSVDITRGTDSTLHGNTVEFSDLSHKKPGVYDPESQQRSGNRWSD